MSRPGERNGTRRSTILKRRANAGERLIVLVKRFGLAFLTVSLIMWAGAWFVLSGTFARLQHYTHSAILDTTAGWGFSVRNILVDGRYYTDTDTMKAMLNIGRGDPVFAFDPAEAQAMLEKLSWVKSAHVERRLPDTLYIKLTERVPLALWQRNQRLSVIDADGVVLTDEGLERFKDLIIIVGDDAPTRAAEFIGMLRAEPVIFERTEAATLIAGRRWDIRLKSGADVKLPEDGLGVALRRLAINHEEEALLDKDVLSIDVREDDRITVRTKPGAVQEFKAGDPKTGKAI